MIVATIMAISMACFNQEVSPSYGMLVGFASMLLAFTFVFIGIKNYRDRYNGGAITFGKGFQIGLFISLIASTIYVITWLVEYYFFLPGFMDHYSAIMAQKAQAGKSSPAELAEKLAEIEKNRQLYKNPVWVVLFTYMEIFPVGLIVTLVSALILKRKVAGGNGPQTA